MSQSNEQFNKGIEQYLSTKPQGDVDLVLEVRNRLCEAGLANVLNEVYDNHHFIIEARNKTSEVQRYLLNRYWNLQLMVHASRSVEQRYCLIPNGSVMDWLDLFNKSVLPFVLQNNLPISLATKPT